MNPALPVVLVIALGGFWICRRRRGRAWAWLGLGLAGVLLLSPALIRSQGIPSPAASLGVHVPWQGELDPGDGNPTLRDVTFQIQPWQLFLRREARAGRFAQWNPHQFAGAPFWANGQSAPLFPLHLLFVVLPLQLGFVLLPWLRFVIAGLGVWALARRLGLEPPGALTAALLFPLSGMLVSFLLFPMGNALALVPWVLWAVEGVAGGRSGGLPLALAVGLLLLGGHPETGIHIALLTLLYLSIRGFGDVPGSGVEEPGERARERWRRLARFAGGWLLGGLLAAAQLLPLAFNVLRSSKWEEATVGTTLPLSEAASLMLRLVLPQLFGHPAHGTWWGPFNYSATAVYLGALAVPLVAVGLTRLDRRWRAVAGMAGVSLLVAYHLPGLYDLVRNLPLLDRVAHHRLLFAVELGGALLAGRGVDRWRAGEGGRGAVVGIALVVGMLAAAWLVYAEPWSARGLIGSQLGWTVAAGLGMLLFAAGWRLPAAHRRYLVFLLPVWLVGDLLLAHGAINPALALSKLYPRTGGVELLLERSGGTGEGVGAVPADRLVGVGEALRPNAALVYGLYDLRGDDPVKAARYERLYRRLARGSAVYFEPVERWDEELLDRLSVRWVVGAPGARPPKPGWRRIYDGPDARIWQRPGALPLVRWENPTSNPALGVEGRAPGHWRIRLVAAAGRVVVAEIWDPGWRVWIDGRRGEVHATEEGLIRVAVPAGSRRLELRYRTPGLIAGATVSLLALALLLTVAGSAIIRAG